MSHEGDEREDTPAPPAMRAHPPATRVGPLAKWGPLGAILTVLAVIVGVLITTSPDTEVEAADTTPETTDGERHLGDGVIPFSVAEARGDVDEIMAYHRQLFGSGEVVRRIFIHLERRSPLDRFAGYGARVVVSGHLHTRRTDWIDGVRFEEVSLGYPREQRPGMQADAYLRQILPEPTACTTARRQNAATR